MGTFGSTRAIFVFACTDRTFFRRPDIDGCFWRAGGSAGGSAVCVAMVDSEWLVMVVGSLICSAILLTAMLWSSILVRGD